MEKGLGARALVDKSGEGQNRGGVNASYLTLFYELSNLNYPWIFM